MVFHRQWKEPVRWDHTSNSNFYDSLVTITKEDVTKAATTTLTLGTDITKSVDNKSDCGIEPESDCNPAENDLIDDVANVFEYLTKKEYPTRYE